MKEPIAVSTQVSTHVALNYGWGFSIIVITTCGLEEIKKNTQKVNIERRFIFLSRNYKQKKLNNWDRNQITLQSIPSQQATKRCLQTVLHGLINVTKMWSKKTIM